MSLTPDGNHPWKRGPFIILALVSAFILGMAVTHRRAQVEGTPVMADSASADLPGAVDHGLYVCPMMDVPPMKKPGRCPVCGMDLIRVSGAESGVEGGIAGIGLKDAEVRRAGIRTAPVERRVVYNEIRLYGKIEYDPAHLSIVSAYMPGVINRVYVERTGVSVKWGQPLFDFYSSDLYFTEQELFEAAQTAPGLLAFRGAAPHTARRGGVQARGGESSDEGDSGPRQSALRRMNAIRHKLQILGLSKKDLDELQQRSEPTGIATVTATRSGVVIQKAALEGTFVNTGSPLYTIADPRYVWLKLDAYEEDIGWLKTGQDVVFQVEAYPGQRFEGKVTFIDPIFDAVKRTVKVGVISTESSKLRPEMIARATILANLGPGGLPPGAAKEPGPAPLVIPATAPLITGKRAVVYVVASDEEWTFEGREVSLGPRAGDYYVVREGLQEGERVVVNGSFKIDSAAQILAKPSMMQPAAR